MENFINAFERGEMQWDHLPMHVQDWYTDNHPNNEIIVDEIDGTPVSLSMLEKMKMKYGSIADELSTVPTQQMQFPKPYNQGGRLNFNEDGRVPPVVFKADGQLPESLANQLNTYYEHVANPANTPAFYGTQFDPDTGTFVQSYDQEGNPILPYVGFNEDELAAQADKRTAADRYDTAVEQSRKYYSDIAAGIDPLGDKQARERDAELALLFNEAGTLGGARSYRASAKARENLLEDRRENALNKLNTLDYGRGADILAGVGADLRGQAETELAENIKLHNWIQTLPLQQQQQLLELAQIAAAGKAGKYEQPAKGPNAWEKGVNVLNNIATLAGILKTAGVINSGGKITDRGLIQR